MKISDRILTSCLALIAVAFTFPVAAGNVGAEPTAYITLGEVDGVAVMDTANNSVAPAAVAVGTDPQYMAFSPDGLKIYVTNNSSNNISVIDARTNLVTSTIAGVPSPLGLDIDPDGTKLYVTNSWDDTISIIDLTTATVTDTISVGAYPTGIAYVSNFAGKFLYVTNNFDNSISIISLSSKTVTTTLSIATTTAEAAPNGIVADNNNNRAYVACGGQALVKVISTGSTPAIIGQFNTGDVPDQLALSSDSNKLYVTHNNANTVYIYELTGNTLIGTPPVGYFSKGIVLSSDDSQIYVANKDSDSISIVDVSPEGIINGTFPTETISLGSGTDPIGVGIKPVSDLDGDGIPDSIDPDMDGDGVPDTVDLDPLDPSLGWAIENGQVSSIDHNWKNITLSNVITNAVVIVGPPTFHGTDPGVVRLTNVSNAGFSVRFQEWDYLDDVHHAGEQVPYLVLKPGRYPMPDGSIWEVGTFDLSGTGSFKSVAFNEAFAGIPSLFLTVQTTNGHQAVTARAKGVTSNGFQAALYEQQVLMDGHNPETVGYLAIYVPQGYGTFPSNGQDRPYLLQTEQINHQFTPVLSHSLKLEEEKSADDEIVHNNETVNCLILGKDIFAQQVSSSGGDPCALRCLAPEYGAAMEWGTVDGIDNNWLRVPLAKTYSKPVVVVKPVSSNGADPGVIRIRNVTGTSFELKYDEWAYLDGVHSAKEQVFYMVAERGKRTVGGLTVQAGTLASDKLLNSGQWESVSFAVDYPQTPAVFTSVMSTAGGDPVTTRVKNVSTGSFEVTMQEDEQKVDGHVKETIGWIAISQGTTKTNDSRTIKVMKAQTTDTPTPINFDRIFNRRFPVLVGGMVSAFGIDPCVLRFQDLTSDSVSLQLEEDKSVDAETSHALEDLVLFIAE